MAFYIEQGYEHFVSYFTECTLCSSKLEKQKNYYLSYCCVCRTEISTDALAIQCIDPNCKKTHICMSCFDEYEDKKYKRKSEAVIIEGVPTEITPGGDADTDLGEVYNLRRNPGLCFSEIRSRSLSYSREGEESDYPMRRITASSSPVPRYSRSRRSRQRRGQRSRRGRRSRASQRESTPTQSFVSPKVKTAGSSFKRPIRGGKTRAKKALSLPSKSETPKKRLPYVPVPSPKNKKKTGGKGKYNPKGQSLFTVETILKILESISWKRQNKETINRQSYWFPVLTVKQHFMKSCESEILKNENFHKKFVRLINEACQQGVEAEKGKHHCFEDLLLRLPRNGFCDTQWTINGKDRSLFNIGFVEKVNTYYEARWEDHVIEKEFKTEAEATDGLLQAAIHRELRCAQFPNMNTCEKFLAMTGRIVFWCFSLPFYSNAQSSVSILFGIFPQALSEADVNFTLEEASNGKGKAWGTDILGYRSWNSLKEKATNAIRIMELLNEDMSSPTVFRGIISNQLSNQHFLISRKLEDGSFANEQLTLPKPHQNLAVGSVVEVKGRQIHVLFPESFKPPTKREAKLRNFALDKNELRMFLSA